MLKKLRKKKHAALLKMKAKKKAAKSQREHEFSLKYGEYLNPFIDVINRHFTRANVSLYRWMHNPEIADDFLPQIFQENDPRSVEELEVPSLDAPDDIILQSYVDYFTYSNFETLKDAESEYLKWVSKFSKRKNATIIIQNWINSKGLYIEKVDYSEDTALIGEKDPNGHIEVLLAEGVNFEDLIDKSYEPYKIDIDYEA